MAQETPESIPRNADGAPTYAALLLSGGGDNGAFGAGFLKGWTESGSRPPFKIVTGISAGALIAPFAFVGPEYDAALEEAWTTISSRDVMRKNAFPREALTRTDPLARLIAEWGDEALLVEVANAYSTGSRLYIGTVLDHQQMAVWNMGKIAEIGSPEALNLFRKVLLASASIPVVLPPVLIDVEVDGERYDEMHVDGGTEAQFFLMGATIDFLGAERASELRDAPPEAAIYIIRNGKIRPEPAQVKRGIYLHHPSFVRTRRGSSAVDAPAR